MGFLQALIAFLGRVCISLFFIAVGLHVLLDWQGAEQNLIGKLCDWLSISMGNENLQSWFERAMSMTNLLLGGSIFCSLAGGLFVFLGFNVRLGAFLLLLVLIPTTILYHHFWTLQGMEREIQMSMFIKNISIAGGLLILLAYGRGGKEVKSKEKKAVKSE